MDSGKKNWQGFNSNFLASDPAELIFGKDGKISEGQSLANAFEGYLIRSGLDYHWSEDHLLSAWDFVLDAALPPPGVVPTAVYDCGFPAAANFLEHLQQGATTGLITVPNTETDDDLAPVPGGHPSAVETKKHYEGWWDGDTFFFFDKDGEEGQLDGASYLDFQGTEAFLRAIAWFPFVSTSASVLAGYSNSGDGQIDLPRLKAEQPVRINFKNGDLFVRLAHKTREPWRLEYSDICLFAREVNEGSQNKILPERVDSTVLPHDRPRKQALKNRVLYGVRNLFKKGVIDANTQEAVVKLCLYRVGRITQDEQNDLKGTVGRYIREALKAL
jgi:hypothetical protein